MSNLPTRGITGAIFVAVLLSAFYFGMVTTFVLMGVVILLGLLEFYNLFNANQQASPCKLTGVLGGVVLYLLLSAPLIFHLSANIRFFTILLVALPFLVEIYRNKSTPISNLAVLLFGWLYLVIPFFLVVWISSHSIGAQLLMGLFILVWTNDTFAYLSGRFLGKHKLFERISPNKTWEGTVGGIVFAIFGGFLFAYFTNQQYEFWIIASLIIAVASIYGDLFQSMMKRSVGLKDSGSILPGHGGILDRFDAVIYAIPFFFVWLVLYY